MNGKRNAHLRGFLTPTDFSGFHWCVSTRIQKIAPLIFHSKDVKKKHYISIIFLSRLKAATLNSGVF